MPRILVADQCEVVRSGLKLVLQAQPGWEVVAEAADGKEAILNAIATGPDVAVIEYLLPVMDGIEVTRHIRNRLPELEVLIFTTHHEEAVTLDLLKAGARGYLLKSDPNSYLVEAISSLADHRPFFTRSVAETLLQSFLRVPSQARAGLTNRELSVVRLIADGHTNREIGTILGIGIKTVETHRSAVMRKLTLASRADLVRYAVRNNLVDA
jgi:DNA-binding NarL/FixJ family response regulator